MRTRWLHFPVSVPVPFSIRSRINCSGFIAGHRHVIPATSQSITSVSCCRSHRGFSSSESSSSSSSSSSLSSSGSRGACTSFSPHTPYDVVVVGVGAHGSASLYECARRGGRVLGIESQPHVAHDKGSSHGETRIIRLAYKEHVNYVSYLHRAYTLWRELERQSKTQLLTITGGLDIGIPTSGMITGSLRACQQHQLEHELLSAKQICERYPNMSLSDPYVAVYQPQAGVLRPERCIQAFTSLATIQHGAHMLYGTQVHDIQPGDQNHVHVITNAGHVITTRHVILANGAWLRHLLHSPGTTLARHTASCSHLAAHLFTPQRQVVGWFTPHQHQQAFTQQPVWVMDWQGYDGGKGAGNYYGFPSDTYGFKIGKYYHRRQTLSLSDLQNDTRLICDPVDRDTLSSCVKHVFPGAYQDETSVNKMVSCIFTNTPDEHFVIDRSPIPTLPQVSVVSACSGHGFKFASVIGEIMAQLALEGHTKHDIQWLSAKRFTKQHKQTAT